MLAKCLRLFKIKLIYHKALSDPCHVLFSDCQPLGSHAWYPKGKDFLLMARQPSQSDFTSPFREASTVSFIIQSVTFSRTKEVNIGTMSHASHGIGKHKIVMYGGFKISDSNKIILLFSGTTQYIHV